MDTKTLYAKLATVPLPIKIHLGSEETIDAFEKIEGQFHLPVGSLGSTKLIQKLQIKDVDPAYFAGELSLSLKLDRDKALLISTAVKNSILAPIRKELSDYGINIDLLDQFQIPIIKPPVQDVKTAQPSTGPKIISENFVAIPRAGNIPAPKPAPPPTAPQPQAKATQDVISQTASGLKVSGAPLASNWSNPAQAPQPTKKPDTGWSKQTQQDPVVKLGVITPSIPTPTAPPAAPSPSQPSMPPRNQTSPGQPSKAISEFDRLAPAQKPAPQPSQPAPKPAPAPMPPPVMLHQSEATPAVQAGNFQVATGMQNQISNGLNPKPSAPRPAVLEFGGAPQQVPTPPKPPTPAPTKKVIIKDFLGPEK